MNPTMRDFSKVMWWKSNLDWAQYGNSLKFSLSDVYCKDNAVSFQNCTRRTRSDGISCIVSEAVALTCDGTGIQFDVRIGDGSCVNEMTDNILLRNIFSIRGVESIFLTEDFLSINKRIIWSKASSCVSLAFIN